PPDHRTTGPVALMHSPEHTPSKTSMTSIPLTEGWRESLAPERWREPLTDQLGEGERVLACFVLDLDESLRFAEGLLALTDRRLLARGAGEAAWQAWPLDPACSLRHHDHAGVGTLELVDANGRLALWRYTIGHHATMLRFV